MDEDEVEEAMAEAMEEEMAGAMVDVGVCATCGNGALWQELFPNAAAAEPGAIIVVVEDGADYTDHLSHRLLACKRKKHHDMLCEVCNYTKKARNSAKQVQTHVTTGQYVRLCARCSKLCTYIYVESSNGQ